MLQFGNLPVHNFTRMRELRSFLHSIREASHQGDGMNLEWKMVRLAFAGHFTVQSARRLPTVQKETQILPKSDLRSDGHRSGSFLLARSSFCFPYSLLSFDLSLLQFLHLFLQFFLHRVSLPCRTTSSGVESHTLMRTRPSHRARLRGLHGHYRARRRQTTVES